MLGSHDHPSPPNPQSRPLPSRSKGGVRVELRFDNIDYALIARLQAD
jgi:hypothetical protein